MEKMIERRKTGWKGKNQYYFRGTNFLLAIFQLWVLVKTNVMETFEKRIFFMTCLKNEGEKKLSKKQRNGILRRRREENQMVVRNIEEWMDKRRMEKNIRRQKYKYSTASIDYPNGY